MDIKYLIKNKKSIYELNQLINLKITKIQGMGFVFEFLFFSLFFCLLIFFLKLVNLSYFALPLLLIYFIFLIYFFIFPLEIIKNKFLQDKPAYFKNIYISLESNRGLFTKQRKVNNYINELEREFKKEDLKILEHKDFGEFRKLIYNHHKEKLVKELYQYIKDNTISKKEKKEIDSLITCFNLNIDKDKYDLLFYKNDNDLKKRNINNINRKIVIKDI